MILLVVLSMLTFFSVLIAAYLVFSSQSRQSSFVLATRVNRDFNGNQLLSAAVMKLIRGTADQNDPFFGEDLLSDYYGRTDALELRVKGVSPTPAYAVGTGGFIRVPVELISSGGRLDPIHNWNDLFSGRIITFLEGPLREQSFVVLRSVYDPSGRDELYIQLRPDSGITAVSDAVVINLLYPSSAANAGYRIHMNGVPRNSPGYGYNSTADNLDRTIADLGGTVAASGITSLPLALQPHIPKVNSAGIRVGDFDESFDAADFNNWFLSYRDDSSGGQVIPSFHRPAVINYILNEQQWTSASGLEWSNLVTSLRRATFRPLPIAADQFAAGSPAESQAFTGSNGNFGLRTPIDLVRSGSPLPTAVPRLDQLAKGLIGHVTPVSALNPWDVDNDGDGVPDSIWIDLGLPAITSPEGKLLRPLVAPMIEDLGARLNVNAHGSGELAANSSGNNASALWSSSRAQFADPSNAANPNPANRQFRFQGLGYGPAEIRIPLVSRSGPNPIASPGVVADFAAMLTERLQNGGRADVSNPLPGVDGADPLDVLTTGYRPGVHNAGVGFGYSIDPYGRGAAGIGRAGELVLANAGDVSASNPSANEAIDDPYEADPTGILSGDRHFDLKALEAVLRAYDFDIDLLPSRLRVLVDDIISTNPEFAHCLTTLSISSDAPIVAKHESSVLIGLAQELGLSSTLNDSEIARLISPELRLGHKLDVNRRLGNGIDDNGNGVIDEPKETPNGVDDNGDSVPDDSGELESIAFAVAAGSGQLVPTGYGALVPDYSFGESGALSRQLLARHLFVLMLGLTRNSLTFPRFDGSAWPEDPTGANVGAAEHRIRRIAQWAVNVIDYRDSDSIMTRFAYDINPFDGWQVNALSPVVWGVEEPELTFSEALATHDVRLKDTQSSGRKDDTTSPDDDTDQVRIPEGSVFLELYCPRAAVEPSTKDQITKQASPRELYNVLPDGSSALDLARRAPATATGGVGAPVWRIAFSEPHFADGPNYVGVPARDSDPQARRTNAITTASFEPGQLNEVTGGAALNLDRFVWFTNFADLADIASTITSNGISDMTADKVFFAGNNAINGGTRLLMPGQYMVIAPRTTTNFGSHNTGGVIDQPSSHRLVAATDGLIHYDFADTRTTPALGATLHYTQALPLVVNTFRPSGWAATVFEDGMVGLNVSSPMPGSASFYSEPTLRYQGTVGTGAMFPYTDAYVDESIAGNTALDTPADLNFNRIPVTLAPSATGDVSVPSGNEPYLGTIPQYCSAFLQRLADPTRPYDANINPYRTVDWISIDLTVFSGEERSDKIVASGTDLFTQRSRQRNGFIGTDATTSNALFSYNTGFQSPGVTTDPTAGDFFTLSNVPGYLYNSFSFLNTATTGVDLNTGYCNPSFQGYAPSLGALASAVGVVGNDRNLPQVPYARHPWLNRPFATPYELMLVPACSQGRLFEEFTIGNSSVESTVFKNSAAGTAAAAQEYYAPFRHLLNYFHDSKGPADGAQFIKILDFVNTLPRFRGELDVVNPALLTNDSVNDLFQPPFNYLWDNLCTGKININTIHDFPIYAGLMAGHLNPAEFNSASGAGQLSYGRYKLSRRGYGLPAGVGGPVTGAPPYNYIPTLLDHRFPTEFMGVFRSASEARYGVSIRDATANAWTSRQGVMGTILRAGDELSVAGVDAIPAGTSPFFVRNNVEAPVSSSTPDMDRSRSPFMRYQTLMRMPNLIADNSQIYVVRLTLGLFEVDSSANLGREYNEDRGEALRYQAMYIIDRSRPVGFVPGQDLNSRDVILFERYFQ